jgi:DNA polymerase elongation subunit (family B)
MPIPSVDLPDMGALVPSRLDRVVAVEPGTDGQAVLYRRDGNRVDRESLSFRPFLLLAEPHLLNGENVPCDIDPLSGPGRFRYRASFSSDREYESGLRRLKEATGCSPTAPAAPYRVFGDATTQALVAAGIRLFRGMVFGDVRRLQLDIETRTTPGFEFPNPERPADRILVISLCDSTGWEECLGGDGETSEKGLLIRLAELIRERDPDVIEGHNLCRFDLPFIAARAKLHRVPLTLGRDGRPWRSRSSRLSVAERTLGYTRFDIPGRHVVDTFHLAQFYDVSHRDLDTFNLKDIARHFGVAAPDRTYLDPADIAAIHATDPARVARYAMDDVRETRAIADLLSPSYFYQAQLIPMSYQNCIVRGNATRIDALLAADYLAAAAALPTPEPARPFAGALTDAFVVGVRKNVWHCDVRSLYPSIILAEQWRPARDHRAAFPRLLATLREFRLAAKAAERAAAEPAVRDAANALQTTFKILINSFYGYLGFAQGTFNDFAMAADVTARGREILTAMRDFLAKAGAVVIEMDTDGIYFQPPPKVSDPVDFEARIQAAALPPGIEVELDATYPAMFCYKSKNYALLLANGEIAVTGAALKSRGLEPFQREYLHAFISRLLQEDHDGLCAYTEECREAIRTRRWPVAKFAKSETLQDSLETYRRKLADGKGRRSAAYELAIASGREYGQGDQVSFYVTGDKKKVAVVENSRLLADAPAERDDNIAYYLEKFDDLVGKFAEFIPGGKPPPPASQPEFSLDSGS